MGLAASESHQTTKATHTGRAESGAAGRQLLGDQIERQIVRSNGENRALDLLRRAVEANLHVRSRRVTLYTGRDFHDAVCSDK